MCVCVHARVPVGWPRVGRWYERTRMSVHACMLVCQSGGGVSKGARPHSCQSEREGASSMDMRQQGWRGKTA